MTQRPKRPTVDALTVRTVAEQAAAWTGFVPESVSQDAVRRALRAEIARGVSIEDVLRRAADADPALVRAVRDAIAVRETYFFRNPAQFAAIEQFAWKLVERRPEVVRAWSAGCATGEEAYSLAATLLAVAEAAGARAPRLEVLATDSHEPAIEHARRGVYRPASVRGSGPLLHPVVTQVTSELHVLPRVRDLVTFQAHDLREPAPIANVDVILCRNVLVYFARPGARAVCDHLVAALAPAGMIMFGTMDVEPGDVHGLVALGGAELQMFVRPTRLAPRTPTPPPIEAPPSLAQPAVITPTRAERARAARTGDAVAAHRGAVVLVEHGRTADAERALRDLTRRFPEYLPGLLERALHDARRGDGSAAAARMREVAAQATALPSDQIVDGLEPLPASFYAATAHEFLRSRDVAEEP